MTAVDTARKPLTFQQLLFTLQRFWADRGCVLQQPTTSKSAPATMSPDTFLRVLGPRPNQESVCPALAPPCRRPLRRESQTASIRHTQMQVILKPPPANVQELYLESLTAIGIDLREHDLKFEEDKREWPRRRRMGRGLAGHARRP